MACVMPWQIGSWAVHLVRISGLTVTDVSNLDFRLSVSPVGSSQTREA